MFFDLLVHDGQDGFQGKHNQLELLAHSSSVSGGNRIHQTVSYHIPVFANFRFHRCWQFNSQSYRGGTAAD
jgi:hypothetical protein